MLNAVNCTILKLVLDNSDINCPNTMGNRLLSSQMWHILRIKHHTTRAWGGRKIGKFHIFLTSALYNGWLHIHVSFTPGDGALDAYWIGDQVGPRGDQDAVEKILQPPWYLNSSFLVIQAELSQLPPDITSQNTVTLVFTATSTPNLRE